MIKIMDAEIVEEVIKAPVLQDIKYPVSNLDIQALLDEYVDIPEIDPESEKAPEQYQYVLKGHKAFVKARTSIEKVRKTLKSPALDYGKSVDGIAKEFQAKIAPTEEKLRLARQTVEDYEKRKIAEAEEAERKRIEIIEDEILRIKNIPLGIFNLTAEQTSAVFDELKAPDIRFFEEFQDKAVNVFKETSLILSQSYETKLKAEQAEAMEQQLKAEAEEAERKRQEAMRVEREKLEAEKAEFQRQQDEMQEQMRMQQEAIDKQNAEIEAEKLMQEQEQERKEHEKKEEAERLKKEKENRELFEQNFSETLEAMNKYTDNSLMLNEIVSGAIPNIRWTR